MEICSVSWKVSTRVFNEIERNTSGLTPRYHDHNIIMAGKSCCDIDQGRVFVMCKALPWVGPLA